MDKKPMLGHKIRRFRQELEMSQTEMAEALEISPSYLNLIEHNQRPVTVPVLFRLGQVFEVDLREFAEDEGARLAADIMGVSTLILARTDAESAKLLTSDVDERDRRFITGERTAEGFYRHKEGGDEAMQRCVARGLAYAPYCDLIWMETSTPSLEQARSFAEAIHREFPGKMLSYNCSPSFNWAANLDRDDIARFQRELGAMGYKFQFVTLAGFHSLNHGMFELARGYRERGMAAYSELQNAEFAAETHGYSATRHQREVGTGYFDAVSQAVMAGRSSTTALTGSTEEAQFRSQQPAEAAE